MKNRINVAELLKDCPKGMELDCTIWGWNIEFDHINIKDEDYPIVCHDKWPDGKYNIRTFTKYGYYSISDSKCVIFPKGETTWEGFAPPCKFKDGDVIISDNGDIHLLRTEDSSYCAYRHIRKNKLDSTITTNITVVRLATEEEKERLFDTIKENGYRWNTETKTLDKLPKFKVGDIIKHKDSGLYCTLEEYSEGKFYIIKKQPQYPKTYEECAEILLERASVRNDIGYKGDLLVNLQRLLICRDAYWFIYNNWKPTHKSGCDNTIYTIHRFNEEVIKSATSHRHSLLEFPTEEMRDEFYENFKTLIFVCKELI